MSTNTPRPAEEIRGNSSRDLDSFNSYCEEALHRYAWLEKSEGLWHFLTSPFADPANSMRKWSNKQNALDELSQEGWSIVHPYAQKAGGFFCGYGLKRILH
jgi:hypothetical protein